MTGEEKKSRRPLAPMLLYINRYMDMNPGLDAELYVSQWFKNDKKAKEHKQLVINNYDLYCLFIFLLLEGVNKPFKKAYEEWMTVA